MSEHGFELTTIGLEFDALDHSVTAPLILQELFHSFFNSILWQNIYIQVLVLSELMDSVEKKPG